MKRIIRIIRKTVLSSSLAFCGLAFTVSACKAQVNDNQLNPVVATSTTSTQQKKIQIALLLDTSSSMDGLIEQAKSQLWSLVNELSAAKCDNIKPQLQIALYQYGNQGLTESSGYIQQISPFTGELDEISAKLFALTTNGGSEYCGQVIQQSLDQLTWGNDDQDLKFIFIAGNEEFTQGQINYAKSCMNAKAKNIMVNTIFCGDFNEGIRGSWKAGADLSGGDYMSIDQNQKTVYIPSPYDDKLDSLNTRLNTTYIYYGNNGANKMALQNSQDQNAGSISKENKIERTVTKSGSYYKNDSWDLVDKANGKDVKSTLQEVDEKTLPAEMQNLSEEQKIVYIETKSKERALIQSEIASTNTKRQEYIATQTKTTNTNLNSTISESIKKKAEAKNYTFTK